MGQADSSKTLDEVVITANRFPQKQQNTGKVVTVIPKSVIEKSAGLTLGELLNQEAGITLVGANNTLGTNQDVYLRGAATGNTLILVDGVPAYDPSTIASTFDINHMPLDQLERIEILRGAQSTAYGSDAVAGVINLITKQQASTPANVYGTLAYGSFNTFRGLAGLRGQKGKTSYQLQYQRLSSDGFSSAHDSTGSAGFDKDGFQQDAVNAAVQAMLTKKLQWRANGQWGRYKTDLDAAAFRDEKDFTADNRNAQFGTGFTWKTDKLALHANYNGNLTERRYLNDSIDKAGFSVYSREKYNGRAHFAELYGTARLNEHWRLLAGMDYRWQNTDQRFFSISSFGPYESTLSADSAKINIYSVYASAFLDTKKGFFLEAGGRYNRHNRFGDAFTFSINPSFLFRERWKAFLNIASAFKAPSLYQLFDASVGSRDLQAEKSITYEAGLQYLQPSGSFNTRLVFFAREIRDGIDFSYVDFKYFNNNNQRDHGLEWEGNYRKGKWRITGNYTYVTGRVNTTKYVYDPNSYSYKADGDTTYNNLFRRPRHAVNLSVGFQATERLFVRASGRFVGKRFEPRFMDTPIELDAYQVFDAYAEYRAWAKQVFFIELRNIFDKEYFDVAGFNTRRVNVMAGVKLAL
jgi:vitamin B12 transporter